MTRRVIELIGQITSNEKERADRQERAVFACILCPRICINADSLLRTMSAILYQSTESKKLIC